MESSTSVAVKTCSKCSKQPADKGQAWCRECRSDHEKTRQATKAEMERARWFQLGARMMRQSLAHQLARPGYMVDAWMTAQWIEAFPPPAMPMEILDTEESQKG